MGSRWWAAWGVERWVMCSRRRLTGGGNRLFFSTVVVADVVVLSLSSWFDGDDGQPDVLLVFVPQKKGNMMKRKEKKIKEFRF